MKQARRLTGAVRDKLVEENEASRATLGGVFNQLALISGGTVALSVTYLGYLKTSQSAVAHPGILIVSWLALLACMVLAIFENFLYPIFVHYARHAEYSLRLAEKLEVEAEELPYVNHLPVLTRAELDATCVEHRKVAGARRTDHEWNKKRSEIYWQVWRWGGHCARIAFVLGIACLVIFAIYNLQSSMPVRPPASALQTD